MVLIFWLKFINANFTNNHQQINNFEAILFLHERGVEHRRYWRKYFNTVHLLILLIVNSLSKTVGLQLVDYRKDCHL